MDSNYKVCGCQSKEPWWEYSVALLGAQGIIAQRIEAQRKGRELARSLKPGVFIAVQDRSSQGYAVPFLIGVTLDVGDGTCIKEKVTARKTVDGTRFDPGDYAIAVRWLNRAEDGEQQRTFNLCSTNSTQFVINSTELRHSCFELDKVAPLGPIPRRSARSSTQASSKARAAGRNPITQYVLPVQIEQFILESLTAG